MKSRSFPLSFLPFVILGVHAALDPVVIKGSKFFFQSNGSQFFIKGVAYQQGSSAAGASSTAQYIDPLADAAACARDVPYLQRLGVNLIRTYAIDPTQDHSKCMALLDAAEIYLISDLSEPNLSINREVPSWDTTLYQRYTAVVDSLQTYSNVIGFFAGNEVSNNASYTEASAYVKAAVRDMKAYIKAKSYHPMGVGYAADDDASIRKNVADYFNCGDPADGIDFWGYNIYEWCGNSNYVTSGYADRTAEFANYSVPVFFAEYGCNTQGGGAAGRQFSEVAALYGNQMSQVFSGGIVYEYFEETNDYGFASVSGSSVSTLADFNAFSTQIGSVTVTSVNSASYTPTNTILQSCPAINSDWQAATGLPPTPNNDLCACMTSTLTCIAKPNIPGTQIASLFSEVCGYNSGKPCSGIAANVPQGIYGPYSMCNATEQLSWAFNTYFLEQGTNDACNFGGSAQLLPSAATAPSSCSSLLAQASASISAVASGVSGAPATSSTSKAAAAADGNCGHVPSLFSHGGFSMGIYVLIMVLTGIGMIFL